MCVVLQWPEKERVFAPKYKIKNPFVQVSQPTIQSHIHAKRCMNLDNGAHFQMQQSPQNRKKKNKYNNSNVVYTQVQQPKWLSMQNFQTCASRGGWWFDNFWCIAGTEIVMMLKLMMTRTKATMVVAGGWLGSSVGCCCKSMINFVLGKIFFLTSLAAGTHFPCMYVYEKPSRTHTHSCTYTRSVKSTVKGKIEYKLQATAVAASKLSQFSFSFVLSTLSTMPEIFSAPTLK